MLKRNLDVEEVDKKKAERKRSRDACKSRTSTNEQSRMFFRKMSLNRLFVVFSSFHFSYKRMDKIFRTNILDYLSCRIGNFIRLTFVVCCHSI